MPPKKNKNKGKHGKAASTSTQKPEEQHHAAAEQQEHHEEEHVENHEPEESNAVVEQQQHHEEVKAHEEKTSSPAKPTPAPAPAPVPSPAAAHVEEPAHKVEEEQKKEQDQPLPAETPLSPNVVVLEEVQSPAGAADQPQSPPPAAAAASSSSTSAAAAPAVILSTTGQPWEQDDLVPSCRTCSREFSLFLRRHHCRRCGRIFCGDCSAMKVVLEGKSERVCGSCAAVVVRETLPFASEPPTKTDFLTASDGSKIFHQVWLPKGAETTTTTTENNEEQQQETENGDRVKPRAVIVILHSFMEHSGRYAHVATRLASLGFAVHAIDLRGHGQTPGLRGVWPGIEVICSDVGVLLDSIGDDLPRFILGHNTGALIALRQRLYDNPRGVRGLVLTALAANRGNVATQFFSRVVNVIFPTLPLVTDVRTTASALSRTPGVDQSYLNDPFISGVTPPQTDCLLHDATDFVISNARKLRSPMLILHGGSDSLVDPAGSQDLIKEIASVDKEIRVLPNLRHEILSEPEWEDILNDIVAWIEPRLDISYLPVSSAANEEGEKKEEN